MNFTVSGNTSVQDSHSLDHYQALEASSSQVTIPQTPSAEAVVATLINRLSTLEQVQL